MKTASATMTKLLQAYLAKPTITNALKVGTFNKLYAVDPATLSEPEQKLLALILAKVERANIIITKV